jgi:sporulation protein YabP
MAEVKKSLSIPANHSITIDNRSRICISGVIDVAGFSEDKIEIQTTMGNISLRGKKLNVSNLNTDTGELKMTGEVKSFEYSEARRSGGIFSGLFK